MGHEPAAARRAQIDDGKTRRTPAPADPRLAMAQALGNAQFTALMRTLGSPAGRQLSGRSHEGVLARHLADKLPEKLTSGNAPITVAAVRAFKETITAGWDAMNLDRIQIAQVADYDAVQRKLDRADAAYRLLAAAALLANPAAPDTASVSTADVTAKQAPLGQHVSDVLTDAIGAARLINRAFATWKAEFGEEEPAWKKFETSKKEQAWAAEAEKNAPKAEEPEEKINTAVFPHNGKHQPPPALMGMPDGTLDSYLKNLTGKPGAESLYRSNLPATVITWEIEAMDNGLLLKDNFTTIYAFSHPIGADGGKMTRFMRCEGRHHGHPIRESGDTSFDGYLRKEIEECKGDNERLEAIRAFLRKVNLQPAQYGL